MLRQKPREGQVSVRKKDKIFSNFSVVNSSHINSRSVSD